MNCEFLRTKKFDNFDFDKQNQLKQKKFSLNDNHPLFKKILNDKKSIDEVKNKKLFILNLSFILYFFKNILLNPRLSNIKIGIKK